MGLFLPRCSARSVPDEPLAFDPLALIAGPPPPEPAGDTRPQGDDNIPPSDAKAVTSIRASSGMK